MNNLFKKCDIAYINKQIEHYENILDDIRYLKSSIEEALNKNETIANSRYSNTSALAKKIGFKVDYGMGLHCTDWFEIDKNHIKELYKYEEEIKNEIKKLEAKVNKL